MNEVGDDLLSQQIEGWSVAEEARDVDEQVVCQKLEFVRVVPQGLEIAIHAIGLDRGHRHAPLDPPLQGSRLVQSEIVRGLQAQKLYNLGQPKRRLVRRERSVLHPREDHPPAVGNQRIRNFGDWQHKIHGARRDCAPRHAVKARLVRLLSDDQAAALLDRLQTKSAIRPAPRKNNRCGPRAAILGQGLEQKVEGQTRAMRGLRL